jgi:hypothetical protein
VSGCTTHGELLGGFMLGALEPEEMAEMRIHVESCPRCAREERELGGLPALLDRVEPGDVPLPELSPELEEAVLDRFVRERSGDDDRASRVGTRRLLAFAAAAAAVAAALAVVTGTLLLGGGDEDTYARAELRGTGPGLASAQVTAVPEGTAVRLTASRLPGRGAMYELWCIAVDGRWVSGGTFRAGTDGRAQADLTAAVKPGDYHRIVVTRRAAGAPGSERGVKVLAGKLLY